MNHARCTRCTYCSMPLSKRHEHDHFPTPKEAGGKSVIPVCINCHDLKDRTPLHKWDINDVAEAVHETFEVLNPKGRIFLAKAIKTIELLQFQLDQKKAS